MQDLASKGSGSVHAEASTHQDKGVTVVEGISYDWRMTPDGLKLTRVQEREREGQREWQLHGQSGA